MPRTAHPKPLLTRARLRRLTVPGLVLMLLAGCASVATEERTPAETAGPGAEVVREFDKEDLYRLLVAEIASQRGELEVAVDNYLVVAARTRDPGVAERAVRQAMYTGNETKSLKAASLWVEVSPEDLTARQVYGALLMRAGQADRAVEQFEHMLAREDGEQGFDLVSELLSRERDRETAFLTMGRLVSGRETNRHALFAHARG